MKKISPNDKKRENQGQNERYVAVKVQRPDMIRFILKDLFILRILCGIVEKVNTTITNQKPYIVPLLDSFAAASLQEINYLKVRTDKNVTFNITTIKISAFITIWLDLTKVTFFISIFAYIDFM